MQNYSSTTSSDICNFASAENTSNAGPTLNITYCVIIGPTITTVGTLTTFSTPVGTPSAYQTYTVAGSNLTADISISAPAGFEISKDDGATYGSSLTLAQTGGSVATTTIRVRLTGAALGTYSGNLAHTSSGATEVDLAVSGTVAVYYTLTAGNDGHGSVTLNPTGGSYASGTTVTLTPVPGTGYKFGDWSGDERLEHRQHRRRVHHRDERQQDRLCQLRRDPAVHADHLGDALGRRVDHAQSDRRHV